MFVADKANVAAARALHSALLAEGAAPLALDADGARSRVPVLRPEACALAVYDDDAFDIDVEALLQGFVRGARARGATVLTGRRVDRLRRDDDGRWSIAAGDDVRLTALQVVNAAGAWADEVARLAGVEPLGLEPRRRTAFLFDAPPDVDCRAWPAVLDAAERWYMKPDAGLLLGSPANADPVHAHDVLPEELDVATGIYMIEEATTVQIGRPRRAWAGLRTFASDGEPTCGAAADPASFFWAAGLGGYGIQTAPAVGALCANLLLDGSIGSEMAAHGVRPDALSPGRFARDARAPGSA
jgi:D-arginine dehydrogenase